MVANEVADKKLERAVRKGEVHRYHNNDWIAEAKSKGVLTEEEAAALAELRDLVARVIAVDDFDAEALARRHSPNPQGVSLSAVRPEQHEHIAAE
jgi:acyl-CoA dehydrogenase